jgi:lipoate-protein ligase B
MTERICEVRRLGVIAYEAGLRLQEAVVAARGEGTLPDVLMLLQHPHVFTLGRGAQLGNVLADEATRAARGVELFHTGRGGDRGRDAAGDAGLRLRGAADSGHDRRLGRP